jgi:ubiquinone/menaquinone biosynthesis C-methylase UbiE
LAGDLASEEQVRRLYRRYYWAGNYVRGKEVLEVACGAGQGLGYLGSLATRVVGADISPTVLERARNHYGKRVTLCQFSAESIPYPDASFDVVLMFEAIYYVPDAEKFLREAHRVLRPGGYLLLVTANKDLFDFTPSPFSVRYYGTMEMEELLSKTGFRVAFFGDTAVASVSSRQRIFRPLKRIATIVGLMPKSKRLKAFLKRIVFGPIRELPPEVQAGVDTGPALTPLPCGHPDTTHKVIYCEARRTT